MRDSEEMVRFRAFFDELEKLAVDPVTAAGLMAAGKIGLTNAISRHAAKLPPIRWLGKEIAGVGLRTAAQGKPMLSKALREAMAIGVDPKMVGLYEGAHQAGQLIGKGSQNVHQLKQLIGGLASTHGRNMPQLAQTSKFINSIPTESKGVRKLVDYGFTPVKQVAGDVKNFGAGMLNKVRGAFSPQAAKLP